MPSASTNHFFGLEVFHHTQLSILLNTACLSSHSCLTDMGFFVTLGTYKTSERTIVPAHAFWIATVPSELTMENCNPNQKNSYKSMEQMKQRHWDPLLFGYLLLYHSTYLDLADIWVWRGRLGTGKSRIQSKWTMLSSMSLLNPKWTGSSGHTSSHGSSWWSRRP